jgi:hypothetical protein
MQDEPERINDLDDREDGPRSQIERLLGGRPLSVYGVLAAGVGVLVLLLAIVIITASGDDGGDEQPQCLNVGADDAQSAIEAGQVERITVVSDQDRPEAGPIAVSLNLTDGNCRQLPQGAVLQPELYRILGVAAYYNQSREGEERIRISSERQANVPAELLATATATPTETPPPTETPIPTETAVPTAPPAPSATMAPPPTTATSAPTTPVAGSPAATEDGATPDAAPTSTVAATSEAG